MKKILCMTGTRADYPRIKSVLKEITSNNFNLKLVVKKIKNIALNVNL